MANYIWSPPSADSKLGKSPKGATIFLSDEEAAGVRAAWGRADVLLPVDVKQDAPPPAPVVKPKPVVKAKAPK